MEAVTIISITWTVSADTYIYLQNVEGVVMQKVDEK